MFEACEPAGFEACEPAGFEALGWSESGGLRVSSEGSKAFVRVVQGLEAWYDVHLAFLSSGI